MWCCTMGTPATGKSGLGTSKDSGRNRVPAERRRVEGKGGVIPARPGAGGTRRGPGALTLLRAPDEDHRLQRHGGSAPLRPPPPPLLPPLPHTWLRHVSAPELRRHRAGRWLPGTPDRPPGGAAAGRGGCCACACVRGGPRACEGRAVHVRVQGQSGACAKGRLCTCEGLALHMCVQGHGTACAGDQWCVCKGLPLHTCMQGLGAACAKGGLCTCVCKGLALHRSVQRHSGACVKGGLCT